jgi:hypothetical protein
LFYHVTLILPSSNVKKWTPYLLRQKVAGSPSFFQILLISVSILNIMFIFPHFDAHHAKPTKPQVIRPNASNVPTFFVKDTPPFFQYAFIILHLRLAYSPCLSMCTFGE